jgi:hypothetical protein
MDRGAANECRHLRHDHEALQASGPSALRAVAIDAKYRLGALAPATPLGQLCGTERNFGTLWTDLFVASCGEAKSPGVTVSRAELATAHPVLLTGSVTDHQLGFAFGVGLGETTLYEH